MPLLFGLSLPHCLAALQLLLLCLPLLLLLLLLLVYLYVLECAFLDDLILVLLALPERGLVPAVPLQVVHAVLPTLVPQPEFPHFSLQVLRLMPFLCDWWFSAALGHVFDGPFDCDLVVAAGIERNVDGEVVFGDGLNCYFYAFLLEMRLELVLDCFFLVPVDVELDVVIVLRLG